MDKKSNAIRPLQSLNMLDRFLFDESMEDEVIHKTVLEIILGEKLNMLTKVETEKELRTSPLLRSIRVDTYSMDDMKRIFSSEAQKENRGNLPKRSRYYQAMIDSSLLEPGCVDFNSLNDVIMIMIAPFDLFGYKRYRYIFRYRCDEELSLCLGDGATRIFLNTRGESDKEVSEELIQLLHYMEESTEEQAAQSCERIQDIHKRIRSIKSSEKVGVRYMQAWEERQLELEEAKSEGKEVGKELGRREGIELGRREGIEAFVLDNIEEGVAKERIIGKLMKRFDLSVEDATAFYDEIGFRE